MENKEKTCSRGTHSRLPFGVNVNLNISSQQLLNGSSVIVWMSEFKPDTPHWIRVDVDIKYMRFQPNKVFVWTWRCSAARGVGVLPYKACTGMCRWTGGFDLSVLKRVYNFVWVCYKGFSCTIDLISYMNFVYKSNVCRRRAFSPLS